MHAIRLRGPWKSEWADENAIYRRTFHRPTGLHSQQRLALHFRFIAEIDYAALRVHLNERQLEPSQNLTVLEADVTDFLLPFNRLEIHFPTHLLPFPSAPLPNLLPDALPKAPPPISQLVDTCLVISD